MKTVEIELDSDEVREVVQCLIDFGKGNNLHPLKFFVCMIQTCKTIANSEGYSLSEMISLIDDSPDPELH